jgi:hypothetical protein
MIEDFLDDLDEQIDEDECPCCRMMKEEFGGEEDVLFDALKNAGIGVPDPTTLTDAELPAALWRTIEGLAGLRVFLEFTNHLSDRDLYARLWNDLLRQRVFYTPNDPYSATHLSTIGSAGDEENEIWLRYYASEKTRERWQRDFPSDKIPPHEEPPYQRDALLPDRMDVFETLH